jgi:hypothetical protein
MREAMRRRRGKGVDISIVLGQPNDVQSHMHGDHKPASDEGQETDMAPEVPNESEDVKDKALEGMPVMGQDAAAHPDQEQDMALLAKILGKSSLLARHMKK